MFASIVVSSLKATEKRDGNTAPGAVMPLPERRWTAMDEQQARQLLQYRMAMSMARELVNRGIISEEEYAIIDTIMTKKHLETSCTIFH